MNLVRRPHPLHDLYETTPNPDGGFRSEQMQAIAKLAESDGLPGRVTIVQP
jgi:hypothetical protein